MYESMSERIFGCMDRGVYGCMRLWMYVCGWMFGCRDSVAAQSQMQEVPRDRSVTVPADRCGEGPDGIARAREAGRRWRERPLSALRGRKLQTVDGCYGNAGPNSHA